LRCCREFDPLSRESLRLTVKHLRLELLSSVDDQSPKGASAPASVRGCSPPGNRRTTQPNCAPSLPGRVTRHSLVRETGMWGLLRQ
jgi:hypothetical protein